MPNAVGKGGVSLVVRGEQSRSLLLSLSFSTNRKLFNDESDDESEVGPDDPLLAEEAK